MQGFYIEVSSTLWTLGRFWAAFVIKNIIGRKKKSSSRLGVNCSAQQTIGCFKLSQVSSIAEWCKRELEDYLQYSAEVFNQPVIQWLNQRFHASFIINSGLSIKKGGYFWKAKLKHWRLSKWCALSICHSWSDWRHIGSIAAMHSKVFHRWKSVSAVSKHASSKPATK